MKLLAATLLLAAACASPGGNDAPDAAVPSNTRPAGVALCYSSTASSHPAVVMFDAALRAGDRSKRAAVIESLKAAAEALPGEEQIHLMLGLAHLWRLAEPLAGEEMPSAQLPSALGARDHLKRAYELCPTDHRIAAWLGPILVRFGRTLQDQPTIDEGFAVLDRGIAAYPSFVLFSRLLVYADSPRTEPAFQAALGAVVANIDACAATPGDPACTNSTVPHNREGAALFLGDVLAKNGSRSEAETAYTDAMLGADFPSWSYQAELAARLQGLDDRIARHANADPTDDPPVAWAATTQCAFCHTQ
jgi:hypothetical protein